MIDIKNVSKVYEDGATALTDLSLCIEKGEFVFITGSSGSGKSSLLRLILRETLPDNGSIIVDGDDIAKIKRKHLPYYRRKLGVVFQDFKLLPNKTVYENIAFAMQVIGENPRVIKNRVSYLTELVGLNYRERAYPSQLSGGEKQRVAIARAIANDPPILLADEPTGNLDPNMASEITSLIETINSRGTTVVFATHAKEIVDNLQKRVISISNGRLVRDTVGGYYGNA